MSKKLSERFIEMVGIYRRGPGDPRGDANTIVHIGKLALDNADPIRDALQEKEARDAANIVVTSVAPGAGGNVTVDTWGYRQTEIAPESKPDLQADLDAAPIVEAVREIRADRDAWPEYGFHPDPRDATISALRAVVEREK
jgi:hypothetical protein